MAWRTWQSLGIGLVACGLPLFGCSATRGGSAFESSGAAGAGPSSGAGGSSGISVGAGGGSIASTGAGAAGPGCASGTQLIYMIGEDNVFYSFDPPTLTVTPVGTLDCAQDGFATPFSMAVDRNGIAWVLFSDGNIYHVDVNTVACTPTAYVPGQENFLTFGMGFVSNAPGGNAETLYVADYNGSGIATIDTTTLKLSFVGAFDALGGSAELTGTGDARLYGFFLDTPVTIAEINKGTGKIMSQAPQPSITIGTGWAFAFWGGDFYLFTDPSGVSSQIDKYEPGAGKTTTVKTDIGSTIVGAGVSTCAPVKPPN